jgi:ParB family chromosome partitioning protein
MAKRVLGKGLDAIIASSSTPVDEIEKEFIREPDRIVELDNGLIKPNPDQPRSHFDNDEILSLAESIKSAGLLQPIIVRRVGDEYFVIAGERRLRASKIAGLKKIRCIIMEASEEQNLTFALIENIQRSGLDPIEEAKAYQVLINRFRLRQQDIAEKVGKDRATVANSLRLLNLPEEIQQGLSEGRLSAGHAKALLPLPRKQQLSLYRDIVEKGLAVRAVERIAEGAKEGEGREAGKAQAKNAHVRQMEEKLVSILGTKVEIKHSRNKGHIVIHYYSLEDFDRIVELLS